MEKKKAVALVGGTLIDGSGKDPMENAAILISDNTIQEVGQKGSVKFPEECKVIDVTGKTVMPGLMDLHVHVSMGHLDTPMVRGPSVLLPGLSQPIPYFGIMAFVYARMSLEMGFTTLRDAGDIGYSTVALRDVINSGIVEGPRMLASGMLLTSTGGHADPFPIWLTRSDVGMSYVVDGVDECLKAVRRQVKMTTDWVKICSSGGTVDPECKREFTDDELRTIVSEAHSKGKYVAAHAIYPEGILAAVKADVDTLEHGTQIHGSQMTEEIIELMLKKGTYLIPTIYAPWANVNRGKEYGMPDESVERCRVNLYEPHLKSMRLAYEAGVKMAMGTDCGYTPCPHGTNAYELELMMKYTGMSAMEAIVITTKNCAEALKMGDKLGTIEKGKLADIVVVDGNPLADIKVLQDKAKISLVMKEGSVYVNRL